MCMHMYHFLCSSEHLRSFSAAETPDGHPRRERCRRNGTVEQLVPVRGQGAWHAGRGAQGFCFHPDALAHRASAACGALGEPGATELARPPTIERGAARSEPRAGIRRARPRPQKDFACRPAAPGRPRDRFVPRSLCKDAHRKPWRGCEAGASNIPGAAGRQGAALPVPRAKALLARAEAGGRELHAPPQGCDCRLGGFPGTTQGAVAGAAAGEDAGADVAQPRPR